MKLREFLKLDVRDAWYAYKPQTVAFFLVCAAIMAAVIFVSLRL